jgi:hypothetical protein
VRKGDSLLLTDTEEGQSLWIDTKAGGTPATFGGLPGDNFACKFDATGTFTITATVTKADNSTVKHYLLVKVLSVNLDGPIACEVGYQREKGVDIFGGVNADVSFSTNDAYLMDVSVKAPMTYGSRLFLKTKKRGTPILLARLPGVNGPLLAMQEVDEFTRDTQALQHLLVANGEGNTNLIIRPYIQNINVNLAMFAHSSTFAGGQTAINSNTNQFDKIYDAVTDEFIAAGHVSIEMPTNEKSYCFSYALDQHSSHGTAVGASLSVNGVGYKFSVEKVYVPFKSLGNMKVTTEPTEGDTISIEGTIGAPNVWVPSKPKPVIIINNQANLYDLNFFSGMKAGPFNVTWNVTGRSPEMPSFPDDVLSTTTMGVIVVVEVAHITRADTGAYCENTTINIPFGSELSFMPEPNPISWPRKWPEGWPKWFGVGLAAESYAADGTPIATIDSLRVGAHPIWITCGNFSKKEVTVNVIKVVIEINKTPEQEDDFVVLNSSSVRCRAWLEGGADSDFPIWLTSFPGSRSGKINIIGGPLILLPGDGRWTEFSIEGLEASNDLSDAGIQAHLDSEDGPVCGSEDLTVIKIDTKTFSSIPADRTRKKLGIGEFVTLTMTPDLNVSWSVEGGGTVAAGPSSSTTFSAKRSPSTSTVHAKIGTADITMVFDVVAPNSIDSKAKEEKGLGTEGPPNNQVGAFTVFEITVKPTDVSFYNIKLRENILEHNWTWPNGDIGGIAAQTPVWSVGEDNKTSDYIKSGPYPIARLKNTVDAYVDFSYIVEWKEEYQDDAGNWIVFVAKEQANTEYRAVDRKCRQTHMGGFGAWQGPWQ